MTLSTLTEQLDQAASRGLLSPGQAHRVALAAELARTLPQAGSGPVCPTVSGEALGGLLGLSRAAVHKHVEHLRSLGFSIARVPGSGYRLERPYDDVVAPEAVLPLVLGHTPPGCSWTVGLPYKYARDCASTNAELKAAAVTLPAGAVMVADTQTGGRGRLGRTWVSGSGKDLTFSVLLRPSLGPAQAHLLSLSAALAVAEVVGEIPGLEGRIGIKWPNDVLVGTKKVCGILLEGSMDADRLQWVVAGIGLNVNSDPIALLRGLDGEQEAEWSNKPRPTSLCAETGRGIPRATLLAKLLLTLTRRWTQVESTGLVAELRSLDVLAGHFIEVLSGPPRDDVVVSGESLGIGPEGQLLVRSGSGETVSVFAGDVTVRRSERTRV